MSKRNRIEIINDILASIMEKGEIKPTHLLYKSNLSHTLLKVYLQELMEKDMIKEVKEVTKKREQSYYTLTEKGSKFLEKFKKMKEFEETFGL